MSERKALPQPVDASAQGQAAAVAQGKTEKQSVCGVSSLLVWDFMCLGVIAAECLKQLFLF